MNRLSLGLIGGLLALFLASPLFAEGASRVVSIGGAVTEIVYALGEESRLVARDTTSNYPPEVTDLPDVGYIRRLSPEGVLSVRPDLILSEEGAGPPEAVDLLTAAAIPFVEIPEGYTPEAVRAKILAVGEALGVPDKATALADKVTTDLQAAMDGVDMAGKKVLFILSMQGGRVMASGTGTAADGMIRLAGGTNAVSGFTGFKPMTDEAVADAAPDVILMMDRGGDHGAGIDQLVAHPALSTTPAAAHRAVVKMDGMYLLGFSVRTADAVRDLASALKHAGG